jgi:plastocyanin
LKTRIGLPVLILVLSSLMSAQDGTVRGKVVILHSSKIDAGNADTVVWLTNVRTKEAVSPGPTVRLLQKEKRFKPHVLAVTVGTAIEFPNQDPFFHDVFSIYHGKPFDLGLYESGAVRKVRFTQMGVSYIFCNIHPDMSAEVVALATPHFTLTARDGSFQIPDVPAGLYRLEIWHELAAQSELDSLTREVGVSAGDNALGTLTIHASAAHDEHKNKYGEAYSLDKTNKY